MLNDVERGQNALRYFHNESVGFSNYKYTFDGFLTAVGGKSPQTFFDSFGFTIRQLEMRDGQIEDAMEWLAEKSQGKIPTQSAFFQSLSTRAGNLTFIDYVYGAPEIAGGIAKDLAKGAQNVGDAVIDTAKTLTMFAPLAIVLAVGFIFYSKVKKVSG